MKNFPNRLAVRRVFRNFAPTKPATLWQGGSKDIDWMKIHYRMERANETMEEVGILAERGHFNAAVNPLYYACFYAMQALLLKHHIAATTHAGVKSMLCDKALVDDLTPLGEAFIQRIKELLKEKSN